MFIDELDAKSFSCIKDMIKNPERCEDNQIETMPMLIFASNNILEPDEIYNLVTEYRTMQQINKEYAAKYRHA